MKLFNKRLWPFISPDWHEADTTQHQPLVGGFLTAHSDNYGVRIRSPLGPNILNRGLTRILQTQY
jgi:hypothetical protein